MIEFPFRKTDRPFIANGDYNISESLGFVGLSFNLGFAKHAVVQDYIIHKIPDSMSFAQEALLEPAAVAVYTVLKSSLKTGQTCLIYGARPIGLLCVQAAIAAGATKVIVVDIAEKRLEKAKEIGSTTIIDGKSVDIPKQIKKLINGGVALFLHAAGVQASFDSGIASLKNGGMAVLVA